MMEINDWVLDGEIEDYVDYCQNLSIDILVEHFSYMGLLRDKKILLPLARCDNDLMDMMNACKTAYIARISKLCVSITTIGTLADPNVRKYVSIDVDEESCDFDKVSYSFELKAKEARARMLYHGHDLGDKIRRRSGLGRFYF